MAKDKKEEAKIVLERTYNIPLRREFLRVPRYKRSKKATKAVRDFLIKHMKSENIKIGKYLNEEIWKHGIQNPPHHVKVEVKKDSEGVVRAELFGAAEKKEAEKEEKPKQKKEKTEDKKPKEEAKKPEIKEAENKK